MAIATGTATLLAGAAAALGGVGSAAIGSRAANQAARYQDRAQAAALQFAQEQEATRRQEYEQAEAARAAAWQADQQRRAPYRAALESMARGLGAQFGMDVPSASSYAQSGPPPGWQPGQSTAPATSMNQPIGMAALLGGSNAYAPQAAPITPPKLTLADLLSRDDIPVRRA